MESLSLRTLCAHNIDLHFHAGTERSSGCSLDDYFQHARLTGRRVIGVTDHFGRFVHGGEPRPGEHYARSHEGFLAFYDDFLAARRSHPELLVFLAPEFSGALLEKVTPEHVSRSDYFIFEPYPLHGSGSLTETLIATIRDCRALMDRTRKPAFVAHPFRATVNCQVVNNGIAPWAAQLERLGADEDSVAEANSAFDMDVLEIARALREYDVSLEVNAETQSRILSRSLYGYYDRLHAAYRILNDQGVDLVPGSDLHGIESQVPTPAHTFRELGIAPQDIRFLHRLLAEQRAFGPGL